jgi:crossover junction endodeoxyribonuclease RusA
MIDNKVERKPIKPGDTLIIPGIPRAKKNNKRIFKRGHRTIVLPSKKYENWVDTISYELKQRKPKEPFNEISLEYIFYVPDKRRRDVDNLVSGVLDILVDLEFLKDDDWKTITEQHVHPVEIDKENPHSEVLFRTP